MDQPAFETGISLWRQVGEFIAREIDEGRLTPGERLPTHAELATRFSVNPHTVRRALHYLKGEGLLRIERGRGIFVTDDAVGFRMSARASFVKNIVETGREGNLRVVSLETGQADAEAAARLWIEPGAPLLLAELLGESDGVPLAYCQCRFPLDRTPGLDVALRAARAANVRTLSLEEILETIGVRGYVRRYLSVSARRPSETEIALLKTPDHEYVLEAMTVRVEDTGKPVLFSTVAFASKRGKLVVSDEL